MKNFYVKTFLILLMFILYSKCRVEAEEKQAVAKKYKLAVGAIFKNEARYLKEWIEYHKLVGVDHFYLYNNNSKDRYFEVLEPYIKQGLVTLTQWPDNLGYLKEEKIFLWSLSTQVIAYEHDIKCHYQKEAKWLVFIDVNEFLVPPSADNLTEILEKYEDYPGVTLASDFYDAYKIQMFPRRKLLIETTELISPPYQNPDKGVAKTIFQPELSHGFTWPPYTPKLIGLKEAVKLRKPEMRINYYANKNAGLFYFGKTRLNIDTRSLSEYEVSELLESGYEIEDQEPAIYRFIPEVCERMGFN